MRHRKLVSQINVVPFIDVMLVLLIVFMIATPSMRTGEIALPSVGAQLTPTQLNPIDVQIKPNGTITLNNGNARNQLSRTAAVSRIIALQNAAGANGRPVVIAADKSVRYEIVVSLLGDLHAQGVKRVGLAAQQGN